MKKGGGGFMEHLPVAILLGTTTLLAPKKVPYCFRLSCVPVCFLCKDELEMYIHHC